MKGEIKTLEKLEKIKFNEITNILITHNGHSLSYLDDFIVYDKNSHNTNKILESKKKLKPKQELHLIIRENFIYISQKEADEILKKYKINQNLIKIKGEIQVVNYNKFINQNTKLMNQIKRNNDSILISTFNKGALIFINRKKIKW